MRARPDRGIGGVMEPTRPAAVDGGRRQCLAALSAAAFGLSCGCQALNPARDRTPPLPEPPPPAPALALPGRYSIRVPPYLFLSDIKVDPEQPLFKELGGLRDQVFRELRLPPGTALVQVFL